MYAQGLEPKYLDHLFVGVGIHGDMPQHERDKMLWTFKSGKVNLLVATDVVSRGLDIRTVRVVVNFDLPRDIDSYVHRIGRTGRANEVGWAYTLITRSEDRFAGQLVDLLENTGATVPEDVMALAMRNDKYRRMRLQGGSAGNRRRGGGRRGGRGGRRGGSRGARGAGRMRAGLGFSE